MDITPSNENLSFTSDYYLSKKPSSDLIRLLKTNYTLNDVSDNHKAICSLNWHRFYTTNYDNSIELAAQKSGKNVEPIDLHQSTEEYYKRGNLCIHLNGSVQTLTTESLNNSFKLSSSSYLSPESFVNSDWFYYFKRDLERASAIVFVGYSLYDIDIQKVLKNDESLKNKTYFITEEEPSLELSYTLSKFGYVVPITTEGFAQLIVDNLNTEEDVDYSLQSLSLYEISGTDTDVRDKDVERMLMYGDFTPDNVDNYVLDPQKVPMLILRQHLQKVYDNVRQNKHVIFYGALGNGKTLLLHELRCFLTSNGTPTYQLDDPDGDYIGDIDFLSQKTGDLVILLDDYEAHLDLIEHVSRSGFDNITLVCAARTADHEYCRDELSKFNFKYIEVNIDILHDEELLQFVAIIDNLGLWEAKAGFSQNDKIRYLKRKNESQISLALLSLLNSPNIKSKIDSLVKELSSNEEYKATVLAICLCKILDIKAYKSIISELADNDSIYNLNFLENHGFQHLFRVQDGVVTSGSSVFCIHLVKEHFSASYITGKLLKIAEKFNLLGSKDFVQKRIFKSMLKFSFVERILPASTKIGNLQRYYEDLKVSIPWLRNDPHFWLQYAMSFMGFRNYNKAQSFLDQAYALAESKDDYYTDNIDTQQARLWLLSCEYISDGNIVYAHFKKAHDLLFYLQNDIYKLRQINGYKEFFQQNFSKLSKPNKLNFINACKEMITQLEKDDDYSNVAKLERTIRLLRSI